MSTAQERELKQKLEASNARAAKAEIRLANTFRTVPATCPFDGCKRYITDKVKDRVKAFKIHLKLHHQCKHCNEFVTPPKKAHSRNCKHNPQLTESDKDEEEESSASRV